MEKNLFRNYLVVLFAIVLLQASCRQEPCATQELTGESVAADLPYMRFPDCIELLDSTIVILDLASDSCFFHLCSYPNFTYQYSIGRRGNGPGEIVFPTPPEIYENAFLLLDGAQGNLYRHIPYSGSMPRAQRFSMSLATDYILLNDTTVIVGDLSGQSRLVEYTAQAKKELFPFPSKFDTDNPNLGRIWRSYISMNRSNNKLVMATQFGDVIEIYNLNDRSCIRKIGEDGIPLSASQHITGYCDVKWRGNDIYALYASKKDLPMQSSPSGGNMFYVFNEQGEKKMIYHLDKYINGFTIDEERNLIIGITSNEDDPIYTFKIPKLTMSEN